MNTKQFAVVASFIFTLMLVLAAPTPMQAQAPKPEYPSMAPLDQYLMDRDAEIALARSAAPEAISRNAKIMVLGRHGYETAVEGTNGFVCAVERGFTNDLFDDPEFWSPRIRGADCYNAPAARSVLPLIEMMARMVLDGLSKEQMLARIKAAYAKKELPPVEHGAMGYMLSKHSHLGGDSNVAHLMLFTPLMDGAIWGADLPNSPVHLIPMFQGAPIDVFIVGTGTWSDGTAAR